MVKIFFTVMAIIFLLAGSVEATDLSDDSGKVFVAKRFVMPERLRKPFLPSIRTPKKTYPPRVPPRPKPHYLPHTPKPTYDNRGGRRKNFGPPRAPQR